MRAVSDEEKVLIVGGKPAHFNGPYQNNTRLVFWSSTRRILKRKGLPKDVTLVILTRFVDHKTFARIRSISHDGCAVAGPMEIGVIKKFLAERGLCPTTEADPHEVDERPAGEPEVETPETTPVALAHTAEEIPAPVPTVRETRKPEFTLRELVEGFADIGSADPQAEIRKVCASAQELGVEVRQSSVQTAFYSARRALLSKPPTQDKSAVETPKGEKDTAHPDTLRDLLAENRELRRRLEENETRLRKARKTIVRLEKDSHELQRIERVLRKHGKR